MSCAKIRYAFNYQLMQQIYSLFWTKIDYDLFTFFSTAFKHSIIGNNFDINFPIFYIPMQQKGKMYLNTHYIPHVRRQ